MFLFFVFIPLTLPDTIFTFLYFPSRLCRGEHTREHSRFHSSLFFSHLTTKGHKHTRPTKLIRFRSFCTDRPNRFVALVFPDSLSSLKLFNYSSKRPVRLSPALPRLPHESLRFARRDRPGTITKEGKCGIELTKVIRKFCRLPFRP